jgi:Uma2 family endonuclease
MTAAKKLQLISVEDYLEGELNSPIKHEFLGGVVYAMAGAQVLHNRIASRILGMLYSRLKGKQCEPYNSDMKVHVRYPTFDKFYYPDVSVVCESNPEDDSYQDRPVVIFEVLSRKTRRIDEGEKKEAYLTIPSLQLYALVEQETAKIVAFRRTAGKFVGEVYEGLDAVLPLATIDTELPLAEIYAGLELVPEPEDDEDD